MRSRRERSDACVPRSYCRVKEVAEEDDPFGLEVGSRHIISARVTDLVWHARLDPAIRWQMTMLLFTKKCC